MLEICGQLVVWGGVTRPASGEKHFGIWGEGGKGTKLAPSPWGSLGFTCCCCKLVPTWAGGWVAAAQEGGSGLTICVSVSLLRVVSFIFRARAVCFGRPIITARSKLPFSVNFPDEWQLQGLGAQQMDSHQIVIDGARSDTLFMRGPANQSMARYLDLEKSREI